MSYRTMAGCNHKGSSCTYTPMPSPEKDYSVAKELGNVQNSHIDNATLKQRRSNVWGGGRMSIELGGASSLEPGADYRVIETQ